MTRNRSTTQKRIPPVIVVALISTAGLIVVALIGLIGNYVLRPPPPSPPPPISSQYSFEEGVMGWIPQSYTDSQACVEVTVSDQKAHDGRFSLAMRMDLIGDDPENHKRKGEALVDMRASAPHGKESVPIDFTGRVITLWVYAPQGALGEEKRPNGVQIFVKDEKWRSLYGSWKNIAEGVWDQLSLAVGDAAPPGGYIDAGFDPSRVIVVGLKMGAGDGSRAAYRGLIYVDEVNW